MSAENVLLLRINGEDRPLHAHPAERLVDVLRHQAGIVSVKEGCGTGQCGTCTVLLDGRPIVSCLTFVGDAVGHEVTTVEALSTNGGLHPLQKAFVEHGAVQCGFCTPGMLLAAKALLDETARPSEDEIRRGLAGNLCRCTGYAKIIAAIQAVAGAPPSRRPPKGGAR